MEANKMNSASTGEKEAEEEEDDQEVLKKRISNHPLYGRLVENHLNCLKVSGMGSTGRNQRINEKKADYSPCSSMLNQSELDNFMEAYCSVLSKLKDAMEEPQQETIAFINSMHSQLRELTRSNPEADDNHSFLQAKEMVDAKWGSEHRTAESNAVD